MILNDCVSLTVYPSSKNVIVRKNENITLASKKPYCCALFHASRFLSDKRFSTVTGGVACSKYDLRLRKNTKSL